MMPKTPSRKPSLLQPWVRLQVNQCLSCAYHNNGNKSKDNTNPLLDCYRFIEKYHRKHNLERNHFNVWMLHDSSFIGLMRYGPLNKVILKESSLWQVVTACNHCCCNTFLLIREIFCQVNFQPGSVGWNPPEDFPFSRYGNGLV